jgi:hypothetical protein
MRIEPFARRDRDEIGNVFDQGFLNVASTLFAEERGRSPGFRGVGLNGFDEFILQPMQVFGRLDYDSSETDWW